MEMVETTVLDALKELQKQLHAHVKLDVRKHYSLMVADAAASAAIAKTEPRGTLTVNGPMASWVPDLD
jgi:hypothetical protein